MWPLLACYTSISRVRSIISSKWSFRRLFQVITAQSIDLRPRTNDLRIFVPSYNLWHCIVKVREVSCIIYTEATWYAASQICAWLSLTSFILIQSRVRKLLVGSLFLIYCNWRLELFSFRMVWLKLTVELFSRLFCSLARFNRWFLNCSIGTPWILIQRIALAHLMTLPGLLSFTLRDISCGSRPQRVPWAARHLRKLGHFPFKVFYLSSLAPCSNSTVGLQTADLA